MVNKYTPPKFTEGIIHANGIKFSYIASGKHKDPLVLCLHGFPDTNRTFRLLLPALEEAGFLAVAPNMRGVWPTGVAPDSPYNTAVMALDTLALIHELGKREAMIVGHGWGAAAAFGASQIAYDDTSLRRCGLAPKRIPAVVAISESYGTEAREFARTDPREIKRSRILDKLLEDGAAWNIRKNNINYLKQIRSAWSPDWRGSSDELELVIQSYSREGALESAIALHKSLTGNGYRCRDKQIATLQKVMDLTMVPATTLLIYGGNDGRHSVPAFDAMPDRLFLNEVYRVCLEEAGYFPHLEKIVLKDATLEFAKQSNELITDFLKNARVNHLQAR